MNHLPGGTAWEDLRVLLMLMLTLTIRTLIVRMTIGMMRIHGFDAMAIKGIPFDELMLIMTIGTFILRFTIPSDELMLMMPIGTFILRLTIRMMTILGFEDTHDNRAKSDMKTMMIIRTMMMKMRMRLMMMIRQFRLESLEFHRLVAFFHCLDSGLPGFFIMLMLM